jgi:FlaA1/EpsC-like NDP-sugar epimerase
MSVTFTTFALVFLSFFLNIALPRTVPVIFSAFLLILVGGSRFTIRTLLAKSSIKNKYKEKVIIYGAGSAGRQLAQSLIHGDEYFPIAFIDDDTRIHKRIIQGITVYSRDELSFLIEKYSVIRLLLAMPRESKKRISRVLNKIESLPVEILSIPGSADLVSGKAKIDELRDVSIDDLLGRDSVKPNIELLSLNIADKVVMVTGAGGSIGSELCRQILKQKPSKLVLFELSEFALYQINGELQKQLEELGIDCQIIPLLGSVQRKNRLMTIMRAFNVQTVYHAAAYKHVPVVEHNVVEGVRNNVFGTLYAAEAAMEAHVETFVLISTDKAVRPTNVMGTTKT